MHKITKIEPASNQERIKVYINNTFCTSVRKRTWRAMNLKVGDEISCSDLIQQEKFFWKFAYGQDSWKKEKIRISRVMQWFNKYIPNVEVINVGFGTDRTDAILLHPDESGSPDLLIRDPKTNKEIMLLEVSGTPYMRGTSYWVRPDKIQYIKNNPDKDVWIVLHYEKPIEKLVWIKPKADTIHKKVQNINVREAIEKYVIFTERDSEVKTSQEFKDYVQTKLLCET